MVCVSAGPPPGPSPPGPSPIACPSGQTVADGERCDPVDKVLYQYTERGRVSKIGADSTAQLRTGINRQQCAELCASTQHCTAADYNGNDKTCQMYDVHGKKPAIIYDDVLTALIPYGRVCNVTKDQSSTALGERK